jgi:hypothetical protein
MQTIALNYDSLVTMANTDNPNNRDTHNNKDNPNPAATRSDPGMRKALWPMSLPMLRSLRRFGRLRLFCRLFAYADHSGCGMPVPVVISSNEQLRAAARRGKAEFWNVRWDDWSNV